MNPDKVPRAKSETTVLHLDGTVVMPMPSLTRIETTAAHSGAWFRVLPRVSVSLPP